MRDRYKDKINVIYVKLNLKLKLINFNYKSIQIKLNCLAKKKKSNLIIIIMIIFFLGNYHSLSKENNYFLRTHELSNIVNTCNDEFELQTLHLYVKGEFLTTK